MTSPLEVIIVGGGIGGLFAANALIAHGLKARVYEQAPAIGEVGAGVFLTPNSMRQLARVGLAPAVERRGARVGRDSRYLRDDGTESAPGQVTAPAGGKAPFGMPRGVLVEFLSHPLPQGVVHPGHRATDFVQDGEIAR